jgi:hypothetical protein
MAAPLGSFYPVGLQYARVWEITADGFPAATGPSGAVYEGVEITAPKTFEITPAKARDVVHVGNNRRLSQDKLPAIDVSSATLKASRLDFALNAILSATKVATQGEALFTGFSTDKQGSEPAVAMMLYQFGKIAGTGARAYGAYHIPSCIAIVDPSSMNENPSEYNYSVAPSAVNHYIHGPRFTANVEGFTEAEMLWSLTFNKPHIVAWLCNGSQTVFLFHTDRPAVSQAKIHKISYFVPSTGIVTDLTVTGASGATTGVTLTTQTGAAASLLLAFYEHA